MVCPAPWQRPCSDACSSLAVPGGTVNVTVRISAVLTVAMLTIPAGAADRATTSVSKGKAVLWRAPSDIRTRDMIYGIGGREHMPRGPFTFVKEDLKESSPKYNVT